MICKDLIDPSIAFILELIRILRTKLNDIFAPSPKAAVPPADYKAAPSPGSTCG